MISFFKGLTSTSACRSYLTGALFLGAFASPAQAVESGEMAARLEVEQEAAWLHDPLVLYGPGSPSAVYVPRLGGKLAYGLTHWFELHAGASLSLTRDAVADHAVLQHVSGQLRAEYRDLLLPLGMTLRWDHGAPCSAALTLSAGPAFVHWTEKELRESMGLFPITRESTWYRQWFVQAALVGQWRPNDWLALSASPHILRKSEGDLHVGLTCGVELLFGAGPGF